MRIAHFILDGVGLGNGKLPDSMINPEKCFSYEIGVKCNFRPGSRDQQRIIDQ